MMVRMTSELETNIVAVERTEEYAKQPSEVSVVSSRNKVYVPQSQYPKLAILMT